MYQINDASWVCFLSVDVVPNSVNTGVYVISPLHQPPVMVGKKKGGGVNQTVA